MPRLAPSPRPPPRAPRGRGSTSRGDATSIRALGVVQQPLRQIVIGEESARLGEPGWGPAARIWTGRPVGAILWRRHRPLICPTRQPEPDLSDAIPPEETGDYSHALVLQRIQPALLGLMDGSVSTLAPLFAAAELTHRPLAAFYVGLAASVGAGISMGLAEALSDDGVISGRGNPWSRGAITGLATVLGGMFHTVPFLLPNLRMA